MTDQHLPNNTYFRLLDDLQALNVRVERTELIEILGSAGIWPASCIADSEGPQGSPLAAI